MADAKGSESAAHIADGLVNAIKAFPKALESVKKNSETRCKAVDALSASVAGAHAQVLAETEAAHLLSAQMAKYTSAIEDFKLFVAGKPPAPKKSAYELKEEQRKKEEAEKARVLAETAAALNAKLKAMDDAQKTIEEKYTDLVGQNLTVRYRSKLPSTPDLSGVLKAVDDAVKYAVKNKVPDPDQGLLINHLRTFRATDFATHSDALKVLRCMLMHFMLRRAGGGAGAAESEAKRKAAFKEEWPLLWSYCDRCLRDTTANVQAARQTAAKPGKRMPKLRGAAAAALQSAADDGADEQLESALNEHDAVTDIAMDLLGRQHDALRMGLLLERVTKGTAIERMTERQAISFVPVAATLGRWAVFRALSKKITGEFEGFHRTALQNQGAVPDFAALNALLTTEGKEKVRADADVKELSWGLGVIRKLNIKYRDGSASEPELLAPVQQAAAQSGPDGQDMPLTGPCVVERSGAFAVMILQAGPSVSPFCGLSTSDGLRFHSYMAGNSESQTEDYDLTLKSTDKQADKNVQTWVGTYKQDVKLGPKFAKMTFDVTMELETEPDA